MKELLRVNDAPRRLKNIRFAPASESEIARVAELQVYNRELYNPVNQTAVAHGVLDRRLGTSDKAASCETCGGKLADCAGHYGYIKLELPVFNIGFFKATLHALQCLCKSCARVMVSGDERANFLRRLRSPLTEGLVRMAIVKSVYERCRKVTSCPHCHSPNGIVKKVGIMKIVHERYNHGASGGKVSSHTEAFRASLASAASCSADVKVHMNKAQDDITPLRALELFKRCSDEDGELLGIRVPECRLEDYLWTSIPVPPSCIRPSVQMTLEGGSNEDDLTIKLSEIVFTNLIIRDALEKGVPVSTLMEDWDFLQLQCAMYINSELPGVNAALQITGKPIRGLCQRLKGKMGRFRGNLSGKRVDFSSRTVISPDPNLRIDQVAVPVYVAKTLTYPDTVTPHNMEVLREAVRNGPDVHPGANFIQSASGQGATAGLKRYLRYGDRNRIAKEMRVGDVVERHLRDGDVVLFNRQPSLHKLSIMAHFAVVKPWRTFRFNECACTPYNADFDGDEMNLHLPQTEEARAEAIELMGVRHNLVTPRNGQPLVAAIQDFITAAHLLTSRDTFFSKPQFMQTCAMMFAGDPDCPIRVPEPAITRPERLWTGKQVITVLLLHTTTTTTTTTGSNECVINLEGKSRIFTPKSDPLEMCPADGYLVVRNSNLLNGRLDKSNIGGDAKVSLFYVLLRDYGPLLSITAMTRLARLCARFLGDRGFSIGIDDVQPGVKLRRGKEVVVDKGYRECDSNIADFRDGRLPSQPGCTPEQTLEAVISGILSRIRDDCGQICLQELSRNNAPLIMQWCGSKGSKINVSQMVACVGQQIISGSRIPDGFEGRSLPHFAKSASKTPAAKGFVQNSFYSGLTPCEFFFHAVSGREGLVDTAVKTAETGYMQRRLMKALEDLSVQYDLSVRNSTGGVVQFCYGDDGLDPASMEGEGAPVAFTRNLLHCKSLYELQGRFLTADDVKNVADCFDYGATCSDAFHEQLLSFIDNSIVKPMALKPKQHELTDRQLLAFLELCILKYQKARIEPGTAVGAIGAQSIGEPGTQMTLKTFHFAGVASMNVTLGVPRIKEIINAAKTISTPIITAPLSIDNSLPFARVVKGRVERVTLGEVCEYMEERYGPLECAIVFRLDKKAISMLQLDVTIDRVREAIHRAPKIKVPWERMRVSECGEELAITVAGTGATGGAPSKTTSSSAHIQLQALKRTLPGVIVNGVGTVGRAVINDLGGKRYNLLVEGYGLRQVMTTDGVVGRETTSNHICEIQAVLGIEAARATIASEIQYTMGKHGMTIDPRHVMLLADIMSCKGEVLGITRFGIARMKDSVLMLASFEKTTDHLFDAARFCKTDDIDGVSECIIMGVPMPVGTGMFKLVQRDTKSGGGGTGGVLRVSGQRRRALVFDRPEYHPPLLSSLS
jgi:DNA-directed RNA polymerase III subunit RPC1